MSEHPKIDPDADIVTRLESEPLSIHLAGAAAEEIRRLREILQPSEPDWQDRDDDLTAAVNAAHPHYTKRWKEYQKALELVGNRHSKHALVDLVNYLLCNGETPRKQRSTP